MITKTKVQQEKEDRDSSKDDQDDAFEQEARNLHRVVQDIHRVQENMNGIVDQIDYIIRTRTIISNATGNKNVSMLDSLDYQRSCTNRLSTWLQNYRERTQARIGLLFNLAQQRDNRTNMEIADLTAKIAEQTQRDSSSMIT